MRRKNFYAWGWVDAAATRDELRALEWTVGSMAGYGCLPHTEAEVAAILDFCASSGTVAIPCGRADRSVTATLLPPPAKADCSPLANSAATMLGLDP